MPKRLLIPVAINGVAHPNPVPGGINYALRLAQAGEAMEVCLLYLTSPHAPSHSIWHFATEQAHLNDTCQHGKHLLEETAAVLRQATIPCRQLIKESDPLRGILETAEELQCTEIVAPSPNLWERFVPSLWQRLRRSARSIPVTLVGAQGQAERGF